MNENKPHSECLTCGVTFATPEARDKHMIQTMGGPDRSDRGRNGSHTTRTLQHTADELAGQQVRDTVTDALEECVDKLGLLVERNHLTLAQVTHALRFHPEFKEAWTDRLNELEGDTA